MLTQWVEYNGGLTLPSQWVIACGIGGRVVYAAAENVVCRSSRLAQDVVRALAAGDYRATPRLCYRVFAATSALCILGAVLQEVRQVFELFITAVWNRVTAMWIDPQKNALVCATGDLEVTRIQQLINADSIDEAKGAISRWCTWWFAETADMNKWGSTQVAQGHAFAEMSDKMKKLLNKVANRIEPKEEGQFFANTPYVGLQAQYLVATDLNELTQATCGLDQDDGYALPFKMAEKGLFSSQDLRSIWEKSGRSLDQQGKKQALIAYLGKHQKVTLLDKMPWLENVRALAYRIDRMLAPVFFEGMKVVTIIAILGIVQVIESAPPEDDGGAGMYFLLLSLYILDAGYCFITKRPVEEADTRRFVEGNWSVRLHALWKLPQMWVWAMRKTLQFCSDGVKSILLPNGNRAT